MFTLMLHPGKPVLGLQHRLHASWPISRSPLHCRNSLVTWWLLIWSTFVVLQYIINPLILGIFCNMWHVRPAINFTAKSGIPPLCSLYCCIQANQCWAFNVDSMPQTTRKHTSHMVTSIYDWWLRFLFVYDLSCLTLLDVGWRQSCDRDQA